MQRDSARALHCGSSQPAQVETESAAGAPSAAAKAPAHHSMSAPPVPAAGRTSGSAAAASPRTARDCRERRADHSAVATARARDRGRQPAPDRGRQAVAPARATMRRDIPDGCGDRCPSRSGSETRVPLPRRAALRRRSRASATRPGHGAVRSRFARAPAHSRAARRKSPTRRALRTETHSVLGRQAPASAA